MQKNLLNITCFFMYFPYIFYIYILKLICIYLSLLKLNAFLFAVTILSKMKQ